MKNWFVTGVSSGIGRAIAAAALDRGDSVAGTVRRREDAEAFEALAPGRAFGVMLDLDRTEEVAGGIARAVDLLGGIDIAVNNAGRSIYGAVEEVSVTEAQSVFQTNIFGVLAVIQAILPHFRSRGSGTLVNVSSGCGLYGVPGIGIYCASKFALEGLSETLAAEVQGHDIKVMIVEPGAIASRFISHSTQNVGRRLEAYAGITGAGKEALGVFYETAGLPPETVADALLEALEREDPPLRLLLGSDNKAMARAKVEELQAVAAE